MVQYTGRLHRLHPGKSEVRIYDYVDREVSMLARMFEKRLRGYRAIGYAPAEPPGGFEEAGGDVVMEKDAEYDSRPVGRLAAASAPRHAQLRERQLRRDR